VDQIPLFVRKKKKRKEKSTRQFPRQMHLRPGQLSKTQSLFYAKRMAQFTGKNNSERVLKRGIRKAHGRELKGILWAESTLQR
jgi:hypothetical protein